MISYSLKFYTKENEFVTFIWVIFSYWLLYWLHAVLWVKRGTRRRHWHFSRKQQSTNLWSPVFMCPSWRKNCDLKTQRIIEQNLELSAHAKAYLSFPANSTHILFLSRAIADSCWHCEHLNLWASFLLRFFSAISLIPFHHKEYKLVLWSKYRFEMMDYIYPVSNNGLSASQLSCMCTNHDTKEQTVHVSYELVSSCHLLLLYKHKSFAPGTFWNKSGHFFYLRDIAFLLMFVHCHSVLYVLSCK